MEFLFGMDLGSFIRAVGLLGIFAIVFAESGVLIGLFLPGDSLLFTAGVLASQGYLEIGALLILSFLGAVLGDNVGYIFGKKVGPRIFTKESSFFFHKDQLERARQFYEKHGGKALILARFMPVIRTFAPILAGVGRMNYPTFFFYNVLGGLIWSTGLTSLGYWLGNMIPNVDRYIIPLVLAIIFVSILPGLLQLMRSGEKRDWFKKLVIKFFRRSSR